MDWKLSVEEWTHRKGCHHTFKEKKKKKLDFDHEILPFRGILPIYSLRSTDRPDHDQMDSRALVTRLFGPWPQFSSWRLERLAIVFLFIVFLVDLSSGRNVCKLRERERNNVEKANMWCRNVNFKDRGIILSEHWFFVFRN